MDKTTNLQLEMLSFVASQVEKKSITDIYRDSETYDNFIEQAINEDYDIEEANILYDELGYKYSS